MLFQIAHQSGIAFFSWLDAANYKKKVYIAGNHYGALLHTVPTNQENSEYLEDSGTNFEGLKIWGSPWTLRFEKMNPRYSHFTVQYEDELEEKWELIPKDTNILITHCPPEGFMDEVFMGRNKGYKHMGSPSLLKRLGHLTKLKLHVFGHVHEGYGIFNESPLPFTFINASRHTEFYEPINEPIRIILENYEKRK